MSAGGKMRPDSHEIYDRRKSRNLGLGVVLAAFVLLVFAVTLVKLGEGDTMMEGFDHQPRASLLPKIEEESAQ
jgi:phosphotransacetylase